MPTAAAVALKAWEGMRGAIAAMGGPSWGGVDTC